MMNKSIACLLLFFALWACQSEEVEPRSFFEISTGDFEDQLDRATLTINIENGDNQLDLRYGFLFSADNTTPTFQDNVIDTTRLLAANLSESFALQTDFVEAGQIYFYRAFAQFGERTVLGEVRMFVTGERVAVGMNEDNVALTNNEAELGGFIAGLINNYGRSASNHGHVYAKTSENSDPLIGEANVLSTDMGEIAGDRFFTSTLTDLDFNTDYTVKAFVQTDEQTTFYSQAISFRIRDGWQLHSTLALDEGIQGAVANVWNDKAYIGIGCPALCDDELAILEVFEFDPSQGKREEIKSFSELPAAFYGSFGRTNSTIFNINDTIYTGGGIVSFSNELLAPGDLFYLLPERADPNEQWGWFGFYEELLRFDAVSFVIDGKAYYGLGEDEFEGTLSDFHEFDPAQLDVYPFRPVASLDVAIDGNCTNVVNEGRSNAVSFVLNGKAYVLTGADRTNDVLTDVWSFDPLANSGAGEWTCLGDFPGPAREAAVAFVIDDKAYITGGSRVLGNLDVAYTDIWSFDGTNWEEKEAFPGPPRTNAIGFAINGKGYFGTGFYNFFNNNGEQEELYADIWEYVPEEN
ncbi:MAG: hypothetical protein AAF849_05620 [Bacteroidota bacterium]